MFVLDENGTSVNIDDTRAAYRILSPNGFYGPDDHLYPEGSLVYFEGKPNEEMEALTPVAHKALVDMIEALDQAAKEVAEKTNRPYVGRPRSLDGGLALATEVQRTEMSLMGKKKDTSETQIESISSGDKVPETNHPNQKRQRGRPRKASLAA